MIENEIKATKLIHPHIIETLEVVETPEEVWVIQQFCKCGDLSSFMVKRNKHFTEDEARIIIKQVSSALEYATSKGFVHRDIKPANLLILNEIDHTQSITEIHIVVADWGFCTPYSPRERTLSDTYGTLLFAAPEIINGSYYYGPEVDVWSLGVTLYFLLTNTCPFIATGTSQEIKKCIKRGVLANQIQLSYSVNALLKKMVQINSHRRISIQEVLSHPWILNNGSNFEDIESSSLRSLVSKLPFFKH